jgi:uncharacterized RDD family membrane protein YckC
LIIFLLQIIALVTYAVILNLSDIDPTGSATAWVAAIFGVISFVFYSGYYVLFDLFWNGQSPGKRRVGIRVIRTDGTPITISESLIRNLVRIVDFLPAMYGVGVIAMFIDKQSRRLGDLAAGTLVVHDRAAISIQSLSVKHTSNLRLQSFKKIDLDGFPVERLSNNDLGLIEDFLGRRNQLTHRNTLAVQIVNTLHTRLGLPPSSIDRFDAEDFLIAIMKELQNRDEEKKENR